MTTFSITTPRQFFEQVVSHDVLDYAKDQSDLRKAFHACLSLDHLADWIANARNENRGSFLDKIYPQCPEIKAIRDISVNAKHFPPEPKRAPTIKTQEIKQSISIDEIDVPLDDMIGTLDDYGATPQIGIDVGDGKNQWLILLINKAYAFWKKEYEAKKW